MEILSAKQAREQRQPKPESRLRPGRTQEKVANSSLPDFPRRWLEASAPEPWSPARQAAEALFRGADLPSERPSNARQAAEQLFEPA